MGRRVPLKCNPDFKLAYLVSLQNNCSCLLRHDCQSLQDDVPTLAPSHCFERPVVTGEFLQSRSSSVLPQVAAFRRDAIQWELLSFSQLVKTEIQPTSQRTSVRCYHGREVCIVTTGGGSRHFCDSAMSTTRMDERAAQAWMRLEEWARRWDDPDAPGYFAGTLGGTSLTQVYFANVRPESIVKLLVGLDVEFRLARRGNGPNQASTLVPDEVASFLAGVNEHIDEGCSILARVRVSLPTGELESDIIVEKDPGHDTEVLITWVPLLAFRRSKELEGRFFEIFRWLFSAQQILDTEKLLLCLENCPHPRTESAPWMEI